LGSLSDDHAVTGCLGGVCVSKIMMQIAQHDEIARLIDLGAGRTASTFQNSVMNNDRAETSAPRVEPETHRMCTARTVTLNNLCVNLGRNLASRRFATLSGHRRARYGQFRGSAHRRLPLDR